ncbi:hypothetical protein [Roseibium sp. Sym1]|uniref:hypothetical protein n=1 Tax=Roseibium sp. Sym1 TaxID=3016006 RepID=UPI0022B3EF87|nr:hypothetical protein [Roseibium sp. Sym1]
MPVYKADAAERRIFFRNEVIGPFFDFEDKELVPFTTSLLLFFSAVTDVTVKTEGDVDFVLIERKGIISNDQYRENYFKSKFGKEFWDHYSKSNLSSEACYIKLITNNNEFISSFSLIDKELEPENIKLCIAKSIALAFGFYTNEDNLDLKNFLSLAVAHLAAKTSCKKAKDVPTCVGETLSSRFDTNEVDLVFLPGHQQ